MSITWFVAGIFVGNFLFHGLVNRDWQRGFWVGLIAAMLTIPLMMIARRFLHV